MLFKENLGKRKLFFIVLAEWRCQENSLKKMSFCHLLMCSLQRREQSTIKVILNIKGENPFLI